MNVRFRRQAAAACAAVMIAAPVVLDSVALASSQPAESAVLRLVWWTDVGFPTPFAFSTVGPGGVARVSLLYDTLVWKDATGLIPWLAQSWSWSADGRRITFALRPDARWQDGRPVTAADVRFTFEYYRAHPFLWADTRMVQTADVTSSLVVSLGLREPYAPFLEDVAGVVPIIPMHIWRDVREPRRALSSEVAVGSGPYALGDYRPVSGDYLLRANPRYFRGRPRFGEVRYAVMPAERQILAVRSGQADAAMAETYDVVPAFVGDPRLRTWATEPLSIARLLFNLSHPPLDRHVFRQALAYAINRASLASIVTRGPGTPGNPGVVPPGDAWYERDVKTYPFDPMKARAMLATAGLAAVKIELLATPSPVVPLLQMMLRDVGIDVAVRTADAQTRAALIAEGRYQIALTSHIGAGGDPDYLRRWFAGEEANPFGAGQRFADAEFQRLAARQAGTLDPVLRRRLVSAMQRLLAQELPTLPLFHRRFYWVYDSRKLTPVGVPGGMMNGIPLIENKLTLLRP